MPFDLEGCVLLDRSGWGDNSLVEIEPGLGTLGASRPSVAPNRFGSPVVEGTMPPDPSSRSARATSLPRAVLFDLDDTLFDHALTSRAALARIWTTHPFLRGLPLESAWKQYSRLLEEVHPEVVAGRLTPEVARVERFRRLGLAAGVALTPDESAELSRTYRIHYQRLRRPVPGARRLLERLHGRTTIGVVSNNQLEEQVEKLRFLGLTSLVDELVVSEEVRVAKPDAKIFDIALDRVDAAPGEAAMIGDSWENDVRGAYAVGIRAVWFNRFALPRPERLPIDEIPSFRAPASVERLLATRRSR